MIHGTEVQSSIGGRVVKFMQGASGPQRCGWQLSTCPAIRGQSFSAESLLETLEIATGSSVATGGEMLRDSEADKLVARLLSSLSMLESASARELPTLD